MANLSDYISDFSFSPNKEKKTFFMSFAIGSKPVEIKNLNESINFSENPKAAELEYRLDNFTLLERIKLSSFNPRVIIDRRIKEVVRYVNANSPEKVAKYAKIITQYINEYIFEQISRILSDPTITQINLTYLLGLQRYIKDTATIRNFQRSLRIYKKQQKSVGFVNKQYQNLIKLDYWNMINALYQGIEDKYFQDNKKGIINRDQDVASKQEMNDDEAEELRKSNAQEDAMADAVREDVDFSYNDSRLDDLENAVSGSDGIDLIPEKLSKFDKLSDQEKMELKKNPLLGDSDLTDLVIKYIDKDISIDKVTDYIKNTSKNFAVEDDIVKNKVDNYLFDQFNFARFNMSIQADVPVMLDSNPNHTEFYLGLPNNDYWYMFIKTPFNDKFNVSIYKFPKNIEYKLRSIDNKERLKLLSDDRYKFIEKDFDQNGLAEEFINDQAKKLSESKVIRTFSEDSDDENEETKMTVDWIQDSNEMIMGFKSAGHYWYNFISYNTDSDRFVLEIRKLPKSKFKTISNINLDSVLETKPDLVKTFNSRKELKDYCNNLKELNED